ncbi:unnamed protein product [Penicillium salamii]|uniref:Uncharacterized protein n=1 Tax=Penicillium salamii TaxID=1612424 RepID=A0A9W4J1I0_9EURO|nr:unnamed protein product [Penicillium salamii]CAG8071654.1 unnamed protein product [Penicillium salamii]CAG8087649.1 unnamed protein product [Penicillium salamii]CAG8118147.1 unnamed protein product [Penicillium salamii]CAG8336897.1 unnamed protein product [Penicillium salamii]
MTSQRRPATLLPEETYIDDHSDETNTEWEKITQDSVVFERECIEDDLTEQKRVILLQENPSSRSHCRYWGCVPTKLNGEPNIRSAFRFNLKDVSGRYYEPNQYYHVSCLEQIYPDLGALVERGAMKMEGGVNHLNSASWKLSRFHNAIEDWFRYNGRTFEVKAYDRFQREHANWGRKASTMEIRHQLNTHGGSSKNCEKCGEIPDEPLRREYFPEEPCSKLLSEVLASVIGVPNLDEVDGSLNTHCGKKIRRG